MRDPLDRYYTSPELAVACLQRLVSRAQVQPAIVYDAHCGRREWLSAARLVMPKVEVAGADLDPGVTETPRDWLQDAERVGSEFARRDWWLVGNPPYSSWQEHFIAAMRLKAEAKPSLIAWVLRLDALASFASLERVFARQVPDHVDVLVPRPSFIGRKSGQYDYALVTWMPQRVRLFSKSELYWFQWRSRRRPKRR